MRRFYALVLRGTGPPLDAQEASQHEVEWWRRHREHQYGVMGDEEPLVDSLVALYSYVYDARDDQVREAARQRVLAMEHSPPWAADSMRAEEEVLAWRRTS